MPTEEEFKQFLVINRGIQRNTIRTYINRFKIIVDYFTDNNLKFTKETVSKYLYTLKSEKGLCNSSVNTYRNVLLKIDQYCEYKDLPHGFTKGTKNLLKVQPDVTILPEKDLELLLSTSISYKNRNGADCRSLDDTYLTLTQFLAYTGCRLDEACSLRIKRLDIENGKAYLVDTKNGDNRNVYFDGEPIKTSLRKLVSTRAQDDFVFVGSTGRKILPGVYNENIKLRAEKAGITRPERIHAHVLRHTYATNLLTGGADITMVAKLLGHKDIRVTYETYIHLADEELQRANRRNPLVKRFIGEKELIEQLKQTIEKFKFGSDNRFRFTLNEGNNTFELKLEYKTNEPKILTL